MVFLAAESTKPPKRCSIKKALDASVPLLKLTNFPSNTND
ncbi:hypothetical protein O23A_p3305 [Aeromonas salmonicida]|jgi:hypothetical protein|nr:hypothetical protein O23A_p3305 [Aeromonas salmonicida]